MKPKYANLAPKEKEDIKLKIDMTTDETTKYQQLYNAYSENGTSVKVDEIKPLLIST